jgi:carbonic anhydrase
MYKINLTHVGMVIVLACLFSCNSSEKEKTETTTTESASKTTSATSVRPVHWSYSEEGGPAGWGQLSPVYALCSSGKTQSPINLLSGTGKGTPAWKIEYKTTSLNIAHNQHVEELINNGHTIQVTPQEGSTINYNGKIFHLKQFHFHTPSEHTVNGKHSPMEIHLVHQADDKSLAVIGVLVNEGDHNSNFDHLIKYLPNSPGEKKTHDSVSIDIAIHVPKDLYAYHYVGSLTTPPCSENVQWLVLRNPIAMSKEQVAAFSSRLKNNNRPTQPMNERTLTIDDISAKN